jgi:hypothetical protein
MDAILFSADPTMVRVDDATRHLEHHEELYWEVGFNIDREKFAFPIIDYRHIKGRQVEYKVTINNIVPFQPRHYEDKGFAERTKPQVWITEWMENIGYCRAHPWKNALVIAHIEAFFCDTRSLRKVDGSFVKLPPQGYIQVMAYESSNAVVSSVDAEATSRPEFISADVTERRQLAEQNLEDFMVHQLEEIEPNLKLVSRQLSTPAGRLDLLCQDKEGNYVVVELKRHLGTDQVVGQILRYMGWVMENYRTDSVRGIIVVAKKDPLLSYAVAAVPNIQTKTFRLSIS